MATTTLAPLLEREPFLEALGELLADARQGRGRLALLGGEAGVGKTALVRRLGADAGQGVRLLQGRCDALFTPRPLAPLADVAEETGGPLAELVCRGARPYEVLSALLEELRGRTTLLVLEDLHWADEATLDLLRLLARRVEATRALVVVTYRDDELGPKHPLRVVVGGIVAEEHVRLLRLSPLSLDGVCALAEPHGVDGAELHRRTGGNAFFVTEALAASGHDLAPTVREAVLARVARLTDCARGVLEAVAIAPPRAELWLLDELCDEPEGLDECVAHGMLVHDGGALAFRHELARIAVEDALGAARKRDLHRTTFRVLEERGADVARLAHHAEGAGDTDAVLRFAPVAAERAASVGAHREAAAQYGRALRFADRLPPAELAALLRSRAFECYLTDQHDEAIEALEGAIDLYRRLGDRRREGDSIRTLGQIQWCPGRTRESARLVRQAVSLLESVPPGPELATAYAALAGLYAPAARIDDARRTAEQALELAERLGEEETALHALSTIGVLGEPETLLASLERARRAGLVHEAGRAFVMLAGMSVDTRDHARATAHIEPGIEFCDEHGLELFRVYLLAFRARLELDQGRWTEAARSAAAVLRIPKTSTTPRIVALVVLGLLRARRGDPDASSPLEEAWTLGEPTRELVRLGPVAAARAEAAWLRGDADAVDAASRDALALATERGSAWLAGELAGWRTRARIETEIPERAARPWALELAGDVRRAAATWRRLGCPYDAALALAEVDDQDDLRQSLDELRRLGAEAAAAIVARRLRERGAHVARGPRPSTQENAAGLTTRELDVLRLLASGLRNREIGARLFVSTRTVDHHVSAILRKLEARTRGEAASTGVRLGLIPGR